MAWQSLGGLSFLEEAAFIELALLAGVERGHGTVIAHDASPDFAAGTLGIVQGGNGTFRFRGVHRNSLFIGSGTTLLGARQNFNVAFWAEFVVTRQVAMMWADREGRDDGDVRLAEVLQCLAHQGFAGRRRRDGLVHVQTQNGSAGVFALQFFLTLQRFEGIVGESDWKLRTIGVVRLFGGASLQNVWPAFAIFASEAVGCALSLGRFQVVKVARLFLVLGDTLAYMIEQTNGHGMPRLAGDIVSVLA